MNSVKVSVIIPVYNTGEYLYKCIDSILGQTLKEIEVLLIDDGSTDGSGKICDLYAQQDARVKTVHKRNEGVSVARNIGIAMATGEYVGFVDSDDWIDPEMYETLETQAQEYNADIVMCDANTVYGNSNVESDTFHFLKKSVQLKKEEIMPHVLREIAGAVWRGIYKKSLLQENQIQFMIGLPLSEDRLFNLYALGNCKKFCYIKNAYYNRYLREGSAISRYYSNMLEIVNTYRKEVLKVLAKFWKTKEEYIEVYNEQFIGSYLSVVYNLYHADCKMVHRERKEVLQALVNCKELSEILGNKKHFNVKEKILRDKRIFLLSVLGKLVQLKRKVTK